MFLCTTIKGLTGRGFFHSVKKWLVCYVAFFQVSVAVASVIPPKPPVILQSLESSAHVRIADTAVLLCPATGYERVRDKPLLLWNAEKMSLWVEMIEHPYPAVAVVMDEKNFRADGMELKSKTDLSFNGKPASLFKVLDVKSGKKWAKWLLLLGDQESSTLLVGSFISGNADASRAVEKMLKSVVVKPLSLGEDSSKDHKSEESNQIEGAQ